MPPYIYPNAVPPSLGQSILGSLFGGMGAMAQGMGEQQTSKDALLEKLAMLYTQQMLEQQDPYRQAITQEALARANKVDQGPQPSFRDDKTQETLDLRNMFEASPEGRTLANFPKGNVPGGTEGSPWRALQEPSRTPLQSLLTQAGKENKAITRQEQVYTPNTAISETKGADLEMKARELEIRAQGIVNKLSPARQAEMNAQKQVIIQSARANGEDPSVTMQKLHQLLSQFENNTAIDTNTPSTGIVKLD